MKQTVTNPLLGSFACGLPSLARDNLSSMTALSTKLFNPNNLKSVLQAKVNSTDDKGINDVDLVLVKQQNSAEDGDLVVA